MQLNNTRFLSKNSLLNQAVAVMFSANGQGLVAINIPKINAVSKGIVELSANCCKKDMTNA